MKKIIKALTMTAVGLTLTVSGGAYAKQDKNVGKGQSGGSESSEINTNRQMQSEEDVRGQNRAAERQELRKTRESDSESSEINTNRQMQTEEDVRGQDRAAERREMRENKAAGKSTSKSKAKKSKTRQSGQ